MTLLSIVQNMCYSVGIPAPTNVIGNTDEDVLQFLALAKEEGNSLSRRTPWTALQRTFTLTTVATQSQGAINTIMPEILWQHNQTLWNTTQQDPIRGAISAQERQMRKSVTESGPYYDYWVEDGELQFYPVPSAGETVTGVYISGYWCKSSSGEDRNTWAANTDVGVLDEYLMQLGLKWRWLRSRKFDYADEKQEYEFEVKQAMARDGGGETKYLEGGCLDNFYSGVRAPEGSWSP